MKITIQYSVSQGPHQVQLTAAEIDALRKAKALRVRQSTPTGAKTITITGSKKELASFAVALLDHAIPW